MHVNTFSSRTFFTWMLIFLRVYLLEFSMFKQAKVWENKWNTKRTTRLNETAELDFTFFSFTPLPFSPMDLSLVTTSSSSSFPPSIFSSLSLYLMNLKLHVCWFNFLLCTKNKVSSKSSAYAHISWITIEHTHFDR